MVVSATLHLPISAQTGSKQRLRAVQQTLRDLVYHPERFAVAESFRSAEQIEEAIAEKDRWVRTEPTRENARERCHAIRGLNERMQPWVESTRQRMLAVRDELIRDTQIESLLASREYAFCLFPRKTLASFLLEFSESTS
jgi:hypothetical protein